MSSLDKEITAWEVLMYFEERGAWGLACSHHLPKPMLNIRVLEHEHLRCFGQREDSLRTVSLPSHSLSRDTVFTSAFPYPVLQELEPRSHSQTALVDTEFTLFRADLGAFWDSGSCGSNLH